MKVKTFVVIAACFMGALLIISGVIMAFKGYTSTGTIDIKSALVSGKIKTGSLGLLFVFFGVILLLFALWRRRETKPIFKQKFGEQEIDWSHWESGDPYVQLMENIFPYEAPPIDVKNQSFVDWISEEKIEEMVDMYLRDELRKRAISFIKYHLRHNQKKLKEISGTVYQILDQTFSSEPGLERLSNKASDLGKNEITEMMYMLESTIDWYFTSKKRIFAGWDKYPVCHPPLHHDLANWLDIIEDKWRNRIANLKQFLGKAKMSM